MKRLLTAVVAALVVLAGLLVTAQPASAYIDDPMINGRKFASVATCVGSTLDQTLYPTGAMAQQYNVKTSHLLQLDASTSCSADGYGPSARMVIGTFSNANFAGCLSFVNTQVAVYNGFERWTNGPGIYINRANSWCVGTQAHRNHWISEGIGYLLGLINFDSDGWNSHVMNETAWSVDNIQVVSQGEGDKVWAIYSGLFCDSGSVC